MRRAYLLLAALCLLAPAFASAKTPKQAAPAKQRALGKGQFAGLLTRIESNAAAWTAGGDVDGSVLEEIQSLKYDEEALAEVLPAISGLRGTQEGLYVLDRLTRPLLRSSKEVLRKALPTVKYVAARVAVYNDLPRYPPSKLKLLREVPKLDPKSSSTVMLDKLNHFYKLQEEKLRRETEIQRHNALAHAVHAKVIRIELLADRPDRDAYLRGRILTDEERGLASYAEIASAMATAAGGMETQRAKALFDFLVRTGRLWGLRKRTYVHPGQVIPSRFASPTFATYVQYPGIVLLRTANKMAGAAKQQPVAVPKTPEEMAKEKAEREARERAKRQARERAKRKTNEKKR